MGIWEPSTVLTGCPTYAYTKYLYCSSKLANWGNQRAQLYAALGWRNRFRPTRIAVCSFLPEFITFITKGSLRPVELVNYTRSQRAI